MHLQMSVHAFANECRCLEADQRWCQLAVRRCMMSAVRSESQLYAIREPLGVRGVRMKEQSGRFGRIRVQV